MRHDDAKDGRFTGRQDRNEISWPEIPEDFEDWRPKKKRAKKS